MAEFNKSNDQQLPPFETSWHIYDARHCSYHKTPQNHMQDKKTYLIGIGNDLYSVDMYQ